MDSAEDVDLVDFDFEVGSSPDLLITDDDRIYEDSSHAVPVTPDLVQGDELRLSVLKKLQCFALDVVEQLASSYQPAGQIEDGSDRDDDDQAPRRTRRRKARHVVVEISKRCVTRKTIISAELDGEASEAEATATPERTRLVCPRSIGQRELAMLLRVIDASQAALRQRKSVTKRDIYYRDVGLFKTQANVDRLVDCLAATLHVPRSRLNIIAAAKGLFQGRLDLCLSDGTMVSGQHEATLIPVGESVAQVRPHPSVRFVLVVEKEATFSNLMAGGFANHNILGPSILMTGKGYPDHSTRRLLSLLSVALPDDVPICCLVDADPHGIDIASVYKFGSGNIALRQESLNVERLQWIGIKASEIDELGVNLDALLKLEPSDRKKALSMLSRSKLPQEWSEDLGVVLHRQRKAEIQLLSTSKLEDYLVSKIAPLLSSDVVLDDLMSQFDGYDDVVSDPDAPENGDGNAGLEEIFAEA